MVKRGLAALLLSGLLLIAGATGAAAQGYGGTPPAPNYGSTYPTPSTPGTGNNFSSPPPVLPRTGSNTAGLLGAGAGALLLGGGLVVAARRHKLGGVVTA